MVVFIVIAVQVVIEILNLIQLNPNGMPYQFLRMNYLINVKKELLILVR